MTRPKHTTPMKNTGFTLIELLVVIAIILILSSILIPVLGKAFAAAKSTEDKTRLKGIYNAILLDATGNEGQFVRPSVFASEYAAQLQHQNPTTDTTGNLMSLLIARNYFIADFLISPVETNPNIRDMNEIDAEYDYAGIDGENILWDEAFEGDISLATATNPAHNSYAHQAMCGQRIRLKWNANAGPSDIIFSNRGFEQELNGTFDENLKSNTFGFHGDSNSWKGNLVAGDGSTRMVSSAIPEGIAYQPNNGMPLGPDNIFVTEWADIQSPNTSEIGMPSGDNWMVICNQVINDNEIIVVWD